MTITADQTAVLEMLLAQGQSYEDLDDLFGLSQGDTRERARAALGELGGADPDRNVGLTDYLLGQADPIGRADAVRHLRQDKADRELAERIVADLKTRFPDADLPALPQVTAGGRFGGRVPLPSKPAAEPKTPGSGLTPKQSRLIAAMGAGAIVLIAIVLAVAGVFSGDGETSASISNSDDSAATDGGPTDPSTPIEDGQEVSRIPLAPPDPKSKAGGAAIVGITDSSQPYLDLVLTGLPDAPNDRAYIAWFMFDEDRGYPLVEPIVPQNGRYENRVAIPVEVSGAIAQSTAVEISLSDPNEIVKAVEDAVQAESFEIQRPGDTVLRGDVPRGSTGAPEDQQAPGEGGGEAG